MNYRISGVFFCIVPFVMSETRSPVLLTRLAKKLRRETGDKRYRARIEDERASLRQLIYISCTRPICECSEEPFVRDVAHAHADLLLTEPIVIAFSVRLRSAFSGLI